MVTAGVQFSARSLSHDFENGLYGSLKREAPQMPNRSLAWARSGSRPLSSGPPGSGAAVSLPTPQVYSYPGEQGLLLRCLRLSLVSLLLLLLFLRRLFQCCGAAGYFEPGQWLTHSQSNSVINVPPARSFRTFSRSFHGPWNQLCIPQQHCVTTESMAPSCDLALAVSPQHTDMRWASARLRSKGVKTGRVAAESR